MKILICGKGGSGKSTISALIAKSMAKNGYKVLVIDGDESNFGLHRQLGIELPDDFMNHFGGKLGVAMRMMGSMQKVMRSIEKGEPVFDGMEERMMIPRPNLFDNKWWGIDDIPREYLTEKNGIKLVAVGKVHDFGEGCACPMGALLRELLENLEVKDKEAVIVDTDAGIEHFGRGVEEGCDIILMVIDPSYESIMLSKKVNELVKSIEKPVYFVLNKVDDESREVMLKSLEKRKVIGTILANKDIFKACLSGEELDMHLREIDELVGSLEGLEGGKNDSKAF